jgi:hypothetical protein
MVAHRGASRKRYLAVLIAYFDESGSKDTPMLTMAGYLSDERRWRIFERDWQKTLKEYCAGYLHMREFAQSRGEFKGWPEWKRKAFLQKLIWVIKSTVLFRVGAVVPCKDYMETVGATDPKDTRRSPFWLCFLSCMSAVLSYCAKNDITDDVALVFDENSESSQHAVGFYSAMKSLPEIKNRSQLFSLSFADDKKLTPLQAADLLAYELNKYHRGFEREPLRALGGTAGVFAVWTRQMLQDYAAKLQDT